MDFLGHIILALAMQAVVARLCRSWLAAALAASLWAMSPELTQAEYRWIERFGGGLRANMPWWGALDPRVWGNLDPWLDWSAPTMVTVTIAAAFHWKRRAEN